MSLSDSKYETRHKNGLSFYLLTKNVFDGCLPCHSTFSLVSFKFYCQFSMEKWHFWFNFCFFHLMELCGLTVIFIIHLYFFCKLSKSSLPNCLLVCRVCLFPSKAFQIFQHFSYTYMYAYVGACVCIIAIFCSYLGKLVSWCCVTKKLWNSVSYNYLIIR